MCCCVFFISLHTATDNAPLQLAISTFFGGVVVGVVSVVLIAVCVLGVVRWRRRMKETAATKEKEGIWLVSMITIILQVNVQLMHGIN